MAIICSNLCYSLAMRTLAIFLGVLWLWSLPVSADFARPEQQRPPQQGQKEQQKRQERLDILLGRLQKTQPPISTDIEQRILTEWMRHPSPTATLLLNQAQLALADGKLEEALHILDSLLANYPDFAIAWDRRASLYIMQGKDALAQADLAKAIELEPRNYLAFLAQASLYQKQGKLSEALAALSAARTISPKNPRILRAIEQLSDQERDI